MRHIILTRYNLPLSFANPDTPKIRQMDGWLEKRKYLFDKYCLPSMRAQSCRDFDWYVAFAPNTPPEYTDYFSDVGVALQATSMKEVREQVQARYPDAEDHTIVSRLDNDDGLARRFVETTQTLARAIFDAGEAMGVPHVLNFRRGWEVDDRDGQVYARNYSNSSFFSLLSGPHRPAGIFEVEGGHHAHVHKHFPVTNVTLSDPMWLISVHGDNIGNKITGKPLEPGEADTGRHFGLAPETEQAG